MNLFGVPMTPEEEEKTDSLESQKLLRELLTMTDEIDKGHLKDFTIKKSFAYYDVLFTYFLWELTHVLAL